MFELARAMERPGTGRWWTTLAGLGAQTALVACAVLVPLVSPEVMPKAEKWVRCVFTPPEPPPPPLHTVIRPTGSVHTATGKNTVTFPTVIPPVPAILHDLPPATTELAESNANGISGGTGDRTDAAFITKLLPTPVPPPHKPEHAAPAAAPDPPVRVRLSSGPELGHLLYRVTPEYPALARTVHLSGDVILEGVIGTDGHIIELKLISGHVLLARAAMEAVWKWVYLPTRLNGAPVEVIAPITVKFRLN